jgi:anti-sigma B factor antagonist
MLLTIGTDEHPSGAMVVSLCGKLALGRDSQQVENAIGRLIDEGKKRFIIDLSGVNYIDSTGVGIVSFSLGRIRSAEGRLRVSGAAGSVREAFKLTLLDTLVPFDESLEEALRRIAA